MVDGLLTQGLGPGQRKPCHEIKGDSHSVIWTNTDGPPGFVWEEAGREWLEGSWPQGSGLFQEADSAAESR